MRRGVCGSKLHMRSGPTASDSPFVEHDTELWWHVCGNVVLGLCFSSLDHLATAGVAMALGGWGGAWFLDGQGVQGEVVAWL
eukprot:343644-Rhodomonas_salina.4